MTKPAFSAGNIIGEYKVAETQPTPARLFRISVAAVLWAAPIACAGAALGPQLAPLNRYCSGCHNAKTKAGGLAFDSATASPAQNPEVWEKIAHRLRTRSMPPQGLPRPDDSTYSTVLLAIEKDLDTAPLNPGRTDTFRRLNRTEYQNAIRDLLARRCGCRRRCCQPTNRATASTTSPSAIFRPRCSSATHRAAQKISRLAVGSPVRSPGGDTINLPPDLTQEEHFDELAARHARRHGRPLHLPARRRIRDPAAARSAIATSTSKGSTESHEVEVTAGRRARAAVHREAAAARQRSSPGRQGSERPRAREGGPHMVARRVPRRSRRCCSKPSASPTRRTSIWTGIRASSRRVYSVSVNGPYDATGPRRHAQPPADFRLPPRQAGRRRAPAPNAFSPP